MKRQLVLIRHAKSDRDDLSLRDIDRPLREDRTDDARRMGKKLKSLGLEPALVICSPAVRTRQTAAIICDVLKYDLSRIRYEKNIYDAGKQEIMAAIQPTRSEIDSLVIVGHNPSLSEVAATFLGRAYIELPTTGVAWFELDSDDWRFDAGSSLSLRYFLSPKTI